MWAKLKKNTKIQRYEIKETFECQKRQGSTSPVLIKDHISSFTLSKEIFECQYYQKWRRKKYEKLWIEYVNIDKQNKNVSVKSLSIWYPFLCVSDIFIEGEYWISCSNGYLA